MTSIKKNTNINFHPLCAFPEELEEFAVKNGYPSYRGRQLFSWIQEKGIFNPKQMTNLPENFFKIFSSFNFSWPAQTGKSFNCDDGVRKLEIKLDDGYSIETVLIPDGNKLTQCISTQVGCAVKCTFCRSGSAGLFRNMSALEILSQVFLARQYFLSDEKLSNIVFMGIGEPAHNLKNVIKTWHLLTHEDGINLSSRRVTVSTVGQVKCIDKLALEGGGKIALAVSLHAADDKTRKLLVPGARDSVLEIVRALKRYPVPKRRRITIEYVLIKGINDSRNHALALARLLSGLKVKINLLPLNSHDKTSLTSPEEETIEIFREILQKKGFSVFLRRKRGDDINAACGQLLFRDGKIKKRRP